MPRNLASISRHQSVVQRNKRYVQMHNSPNRERYPCFHRANFNRIGRDRFVPAKAPFDCIWFAVPGLIAIFAGEGGYARLEDESPSSLRPQARETAPWPPSIPTTS